MTHPPEDDPEPTEDEILPETGVTEDEIPGTPETGVTQDELPGTPGTAAPTATRPGNGGRDLRGDTGRLPRALRDRFGLRAVIRRPGRPHQAAVYRVEDDKGRIHILKWYHRGHAPDPRVRDLLFGRPRPHLLHLTEADDRAADGHPYELGPSYGETDLARYLKDNPGPVAPDFVHSVVRQVHAALTTLHELGIVHRDVSPANIVLSRMDPAEPELVLVDFGVSVRLGDGTDTAEEPGAGHRRWAGTAAYMSPQMALRHQSVQPEADWWSLGMIVAEMTGGRHPIPHTEPDIIEEELSSRAPDLSRVTDSRLRLLCTGLLTRDPDHRWGSDEVAQWLAGSSPRVAPWDPGSAPGPSGGPDEGIEPFSFLGEEFTRPQQLAKAFDENWQAMRNLLADRGRREEFTGWVRQFENPGRDSGELTELRGLLGDRRHRTRPATLVRLVSWLGPRLAASYRGVTLDPRGLLELSRAAENGDEFSLSVVEDLREHSILPLLDARPGGEGLAETHRRWRGHRSRWEHVVNAVAAESSWLDGARDQLRTATRADRLLLAALLTLAVAPEPSRRHLDDRANLVLGRLPQEVEWYRRLVRESDDLVRMLLADRLSGLAMQEAEEEWAHVQQNHAEERVLRDMDVVALWLRRQDLAPTLGWAAGGAVALIAPWLFLIGLSDVAGWAPQPTVVVAWMLAVPGAAAVLALELWTGYRIGSPGYHPDRSLAGLVIDRSRRPAAFVHRPGSRFPVRGLLLLVPFFLLWLTLRYAAWVWPAVTVAALAVWSRWRLRDWRRHVAELRARPVRRPAAAPSHTGGRR